MLRNQSPDETAQSEGTELVRTGRLLHRTVAELDNADSSAERLVLHVNRASLAVHHWRVTPHRHHHLTSLPTATLNLTDAPPPPMLCVRSSLALDTTLPAVDVYCLNDNSSEDAV